MDKSADVIAGYILIKLAEVPEDIRKIVDAIASKYKKYGVSPPSASALNKLFPAGWEKIHGTNSAQEVLLNSKWMQEANNLKAGWSARDYTSSRRSKYTPGGSRGAYYQKHVSPEADFTEWFIRSKKDPANMRAEYSAWKKRYGGAATTTFSDWVKKTKGSAATMADVLDDSLVNRWKRQQKLRWLGLGVGAVLPAALAGIKAYVDNEADKKIKLGPSPVLDKITQRRVKNYEKAAPLNRTKNKRMSVGLGLTAGLGGALLAARLRSFPGKPAIRLGNLIPSAYTGLVLAGNGAVIGSALDANVYKNQQIKRMRGVLRRLDSMPNNRKITATKIWNEYAKEG